MKAVKVELNATKRRKTAELDHVRLLLFQRGLDYKQLAAMTGFSPRRIANCLTGNDTSWPMRAAVNRALKTPIFVKRPRRRALGQDAGPRKSSKAQRRDGTAMQTEAPRDGPVQAGAQQGGAAPGAAENGASPLGSGGAASHISPVPTEPRGGHEPKASETTGEQGA
jgi:hypothetical protein